MELASPMSYRLTLTEQPPAIVDARSKLRCVSLCEACIAPLRGCMRVRAVAGTAQPMERRTSARDRQWLTQWHTLGLCSLADKAVHTPIESMHRA